MTSETNKRVVDAIVIVIGGGLIGPLVTDVADGRSINLLIDSFAVDRFVQHGSSQAA